MTIQMENPEEMNLEQMKALVESSRMVRFSIDGREVLYRLLVRVLKNQHYAELRREQRGIVRRFLAKVTGRSRARGVGRAGSPEDLAARVRSLLAPGV
jgi:hypothetical protein